MKKIIFITLLISIVTLSLFFRFVNNFSKKKYKHYIFLKFNRIKTSFFKDISNIKDKDLENKIIVYNDIIENFEEIYILNINSLIKFHKNKEKINKFDNLIRKYDLLSVNSTETRIIKDDFLIFINKFKKNNKTYFLIFKIEKNILDKGYYNFFYTQIVFILFFIFIIMITLFLLFTFYISTPIKITLNQLDEIFTLKDYSKRILIKATPAISKIIEYINKLLYFAEVREKELIKYNKKLENELKEKYKQLKKDSFFK